MKTFSILLLTFIFSISHAQPDLTTAQWQSDVRYLQKTVHDEYPFLFKKVTKELFDAEVEELCQDIPYMADHEVIVGLARLVAMFQYGHTAIGLSWWWDHRLTGFHQAPFNLYQYSDGVYVQGVHKAFTDALGAKVLKVEGMDVEKAMDAVRPTVSAENDQFFKSSGLTYLGVPEILHAQKVTRELKKTVTLTLIKDGKTFDLAFPAIPMDSLTFPGNYGLIAERGDWLDARDNSQTPLYLKNMDRIYYFEYLPEHKTVYVRHSQIQNDAQETVEDFYARLFKFIEENEVARLVLDFRLNGGGNNYLNKPVITGLIRCEKINQPGKLFAIIGRRTFSACQNMVNELDNYTEVIFAGEPTGENINFYGDVNRVTLPESKIPVYLSFAWWQDKPQWEDGPWMAPLLAIDMSFDDYRTNRDPVLEACLNFSAEGVIIDPMAHLTELFMAGKMDELRTDAKKMVGDPLYRYVEFEDELNRAGYRLLGMNQVDGAIFVFQLNTELFPSSANTWDSLGEAHWKAGQTAKAIEFYQHAVQLDPDGLVGENARKMLEKIRSGE